METHCKISHQSSQNNLYETAFNHFGKTFKTQRNTQWTGKNKTEWFNEECRNATQDFNKSRNEYQRHKTESNRKELTQLRTSLNHTKRRAIARHKFENGREITKQAKKEPKSVLEIFETILQKEEY